jgi:hypothetical protein
MVNCVVGFAKRFIRYLAARVFGATGETHRQLLAHNIATKDAGPAGLALHKYGVDATVNCKARLSERTAAAADPSKAQIIFLLDERHQVNRIIDDNVQNAIAILDLFPSAVFVLEHFAPGPINVNTTCLGGDSSFRDRLLAAHPDATLIGGDNVKCLETLLKLKADECDDPILAIEEAVPLRGEAEALARRQAEAAARRKSIEIDYLERSNQHECQWTRSLELISRALAANGRVAVINAGANHITHIFNNESATGGSLIVDHDKVSFIRLRAESFPLQ